MAKKRTELRSTQSARKRTSPAQPATAAALPADAGFIRLRGVRQNNLKGFDLDIPLGSYIAVTGLSGAGKSSLVFDTLHAEGQRRYVETFSAYTRQFLDLLDKPKVDSVENIRPSIAIEQTNTVKTSRSTVGTMTELTDFFKVWFSHVAECYDPETGEKVEDDTPQTIWRKTLAAASGQTLVVAFQVTRPASLAWPEILKNLKAQSYLRVLVPKDTAAVRAAVGPDLASGRARATASNSALRVPHAAFRIDDLLADTAPLDHAAHILVAQDRIEITDASRARFIEAAEAALHFGHGRLHLFASAPAATGAAAALQPSVPSSVQSFLLHASFSTGLHSPATGRTFRPATPALFSFNSPLGACPRCRGFGRIIEIDYRLAIPDASLSIEQGAIKAFEGQVYSMSRDDLIRAAHRHKIPTGVPYAALTEKQRDFVIYGEPEYRARKARGGEIGYEEDIWYGVKGFFDWLEKNTYKMPVRVFLSRYRAYNPCPDCRGQRLQPEALCWKWLGRTLPELYTLPVGELLALIGDSSESTLARPSASLETHSAKLAHDSILTRLRYLVQVGLGYLTLDRSSKTLSGGEVERVNLTSCLGTSLVDTLFVLDEPSVGLHPRDIDRLIAIIRTLTDAGNTVVVVEHDEAMIRAADHIIEVGPEPGARGGRIVFSGQLQALLAEPASITGAYLSGRETIAAPQTRRPVAGGATAAAGTAFLRFEGASKHNIRDLSLTLPLNRLVCLSGVSGSGKSTLLDNIIHQGILSARHQLTEDPASISRIEGLDTIGEIVLVDQSPLSRTPRSNPALYTEAWEHIRELYAATPAAQSAGYTASSFSFNAGDGRCEHCNGLGSERVEMQFLSDVYVPCPVCEGRRFKPEILAITWRDRSISDLLNTSIDDALALFADEPVIHARLSTLATVGLGYLTLGQPLNTLSGGESQRLKLVRHLPNAECGTRSAELKTTQPDTPPPAAVPSAPPLASAHSALRASKSAIRTPHSAFPKGALLLLDEPTTGLHRHDVKRLLSVLQALVDAGHSVIVIEHNLDVLKSADWLIEIGPEAGADGGRIVAEGTPEQIAQTNTATAPYLAAALAAANSKSQIADPKKNSKNKSQKSASASAAGAAAPHSAIRIPQSALAITGARENNLKNLSLTIPHRRLNVVTGVSGSGKSTLAFDIVFAEGQRRFMESMSPYARQFVEQLPRPDIDRLTGIPPTVAIEQRVTRGTRKSTVATITEVAQYLRLLYARLGVQHHPDTGRPVEPLTPAQLKQLLLRVLHGAPAARKARHLYLCAPLIRGRKGHHQPIATWIEKQGYALMRADGRLLPVAKFQKLDRYKEHDIEAVTADLKTDANPGAALDEGLRLGRGTCFLLTEKNEILSYFSTTHTDAETGESFPELDPKHFSFNSPRGWCPACRGHGRIYPWMLQLDQEDADNADQTLLLRTYGVEHADDVGDAGRPCPECHGDRLNRTARAVKLRFTSNDELRVTNDEFRKKESLPAPSAAIRNSPLAPYLAKLTAEAATRPATTARAAATRSASSNPQSAFSLSLPELLRATPGQLLALLRRLDLPDARARAITQDILPQIEERLRFLDHVGLGYLSLDRPTETLSGGEAQRIRLAAQLGSNLSGVLYVLDEPSIGLHARDNDRLIETLKTLREKGNTLLVVEHDDELMTQADHIIDLGPAAGIHGGELLAEGTPEEIKKSPASLTGLFLAKGIKHPVRGSYRDLPKSPPPSKTK
ncbi:ATP-binding cassette domain-containing protein [Termitidicoccus mucosus]|uniref:UvrABC system protein A n=1 Tax=Termitidicoccus mucosus TaxID=1184151 RepID=A0A178IJ45_9BACT|nr:excinuclease ABC subunit A [Opitutaceae bacterium TSB47]